MWQSMLIRILLNNWKLLGLEESNGYEEEDTLDAVKQNFLEAHPYEDMKLKKHMGRGIWKKPSCEKFSR